MSHLEKFCDVVDYMRFNRNTSFSAQDLMVFAQCSDETMWKWMRIMQKHNWIKPSGSVKNIGIRGLKPVLWQWCGGNDGSNT